MKKSIIIVVLVLITSMATAQTNKGKQTDRLEASSMLKYRQGVEYIKNTIETFRYEGNLEAKEWLTGGHQPIFSGEATTEEEQKERDHIRSAYYEQQWKMQNTCPKHDNLFMLTYVMIFIYFVYLAVFTGIADTIPFSSLLKSTMKFATNSVAE